MSSTPILLQDNTGSVSFFLEDSDGDPVTGLTDADVTADLKKSGGSFASFALSGGNFTEIGLGFYEIDLAAADTDTLGNLYLRLSGPLFKSTLVSAFVAESVPVNPTTPISIPKTDLFGYVYQSNGEPASNVSVSARVLVQPTLLNPSGEAVAIKTELVTVKTDSDGYFIISLLTGADVDVFIPSVNYRRTLQVPASSQNLFSIP